MLTFLLPPHWRLAAVAVLASDSTGDGDRERDETPVCSSCVEPRLAVPVASRLYTSRSELASTCCSSCWWTASRSKTCFTWLCSSLLLASRWAANVAWFSVMPTNLASR